MQQVIILSGISGSGKSTYAKMLQLDLVNAQIVSADNYFMVDGEYKFDPRKLGEAHSSCLRAFIEHLSSWQQTVIVDNTNTTVLEIAPYYAVGKAYGAKVKLITVEVDPVVAAKRNAHGVNLATCERMARNLAERKLPPYWDIELQNV